MSFDETCKYFDLVNYSCVRPYSLLLYLLDYNKLGTSFLKLSKFWVLALKYSSASS